MNNKQRVANTIFTFEKQDRDDPILSLKKTKWFSFTFPVFFIFFIIFWFSFSFLFSQTPEDIYTKLTNTYSQISTWQANISQTNYFHQTKAKIVSYGKFYFQPSKLLIRYTKPKEQILSVQNGILTIYDKANNIAMKSELITAIQSLNPLEIIKTYWESSEKKMISSSQNNVTVSLKPRSDTQIKEIIFSLAMDTGYITSLTYKDQQNNTVKIELTKTKINKAIPSSVWKVVIPPNAQIIER